MSKLIMKSIDRAYENINLLEIAIKNCNNMDQKLILRNMKKVLEDQVLEVICKYM